MDLLKLIPQLFYDLISRVVPGALAIVVLAAAANASIEGLLTGTLADASPLKQSALFLGLAFFVAAYFIGHLISPLSDLFHRKLIGKLFRRHFEVLREAISAGSEYGDDVRQFLVTELGLPNGADVASISGDRLNNAMFTWQDWLRIKSPDAGVRAAKVRAEYRMHGQNAVVLIVGLICHLLLATGGHLKPGTAIIVLTLAGAVVSMWAAARTYKNFQIMVINQYFSIRGPTRAGSRISV